MRLAGVGDNVVDRYRDLEVWYPGGQALNVAVWANRYGLPSAYVGVLGDDPAGRHVLEAIRAEGVDDSHVRVVPGPNAFTDVVLVDGNREFVGSDVGVSRFTVSSDDLAWLADFDFVHASASSGLEEQLAAMAAVAPLSFDFSARRDTDYVDPILPHVTVAAFSLADMDDAGSEAWLERACRSGARFSLATRGAADAILFDGHRHWRQPTLATDVVDTLGAGDAFTARLLVGLLRDEPHDVTLAAAAAAAAATCSMFGAFGYPMTAPTSASAGPGVTDRVPTALARTRAEP